MLLYFLQVVRDTYTTEGQKCSTDCAQQGEEYWWCVKPKKFTTGKTTDEYWDKCSPAAGRTM